MASPIATIPTDSDANKKSYIVAIAEFINNSFPTEKNVWTSLTEQVKNEYVQKVSEAYNFVLSNQPKPVAQPPQEPEIPIFLFEPKLLSASIGKIVNGLIISLNPKADKRRIFSTRLIYKGDSICVSGSGDQNLGTQYVSSDEQTFNMTFNEIFDTLACLGEPINDLVGKYNLNFEMYSTPIKSDGSPDPTRSQFSEIFSLNFEYNQSGTPILI